jgi:ribose transport system permease protein
MTATSAARQTAGPRLPTTVRERLSEVVSQLAAAGALIVVFVYLSFASPYFLTADNLFNIGVQSSVIALIAIAETLVILTAGIDLSVGSVAALAGMLGVMAMAQAGMPVLVGVLAGIAVGALAGLVNGLLVARAQLAPFIATLGMFGVARGLAFIVSGAVAVYGAPDSFRLVGEGQIGPVPLPIIYLVIAAVLGHIVFTRTKLGRYSYAIGSNPDAARLSGIPVRRYLTYVYVIVGAMAGFGGMILASRVHSGQPNTAIGLELDVIAAAVIGGASLFGGQGTVVGTLIGAFLIGLIRDGAVLLNITQYYQQVIIGVIIWLAVFWDQWRRRRLSAATETNRRESKGADARVENGSGPHSGDRDGGVRHSDGAPGTDHAGSG